MKIYAPSIVFLVLLLFSSLSVSEEKSDPVSGASPSDNLPAHITRLTDFGQRADWSHDGKRILFLAKTFGDVYEIEVATRKIRPITHHYYHEGYTRAFYLANGDFLLSGAVAFDAEKPLASRWENAELWVMDKSLTKPPIPLGQKCFEGPAISRKNMRVAWSVGHRNYPGTMGFLDSQIWVADIVYENGIPELQNKRLILETSKLDFNCFPETQNFRPTDENELIFSAYQYQGTEVMGVNIETKEITNYSNAPDQYDEAEGIFPDGKHILVECDKQNKEGMKSIDIWKLTLDSSGEYERMTYFSDFPGYKASNPVVSDDGKFIAFQLAHSSDPPGIGHGIFVYDINKSAQK